MSTLITECLNSYGKQMNFLCSFKCLIFMSEKFYVDLKLEFNGFMVF